MILSDAAVTEALGRALAPALRAGDVVALEGGLGAGKTTFARGLVHGLGYVGDVPSPSFAIVQPYEVPAVRLSVAHVDLYRLDSPNELAELGLEEWLSDGALIVEWPNRLPTTLLADALRLSFSVDAHDARVLTATVPTAWTARWPPR